MIGPWTSPAWARCTPCPPSEHLDLVARSGRDGAEPAGRAPTEVAVVEIDPELADTAAHVRGLLPAAGPPAPTAWWSPAAATARSGSPPAWSRADTRADVNNLVRRTLDVRKASFLSMDRAVEESGMEYGGITPIGLPAGVAGAGGRGRA